MRSLYGLAFAAFIAPVGICAANAQISVGDARVARVAAETSSRSNALLEPSNTELKTPIYSQDSLSRAAVVIPKVNFAATAPAVSPAINTTIEVRADLNENAHDAPATFHASADQIFASAGTYGDFSRYLQLFPGVVFNNDTSNDILVRGGNPIENLYLVDGIQVPNINHISSAASSGGFAAMIDTATIQNVDFRAGGYDSSFDERLSSVIEIHTREAPRGSQHSELNFGITGAGGISDWLLPNGSSLLVSAHRSLLNLFTKDVGLNGTPIYTNALTRATIKAFPSDQITVLSLGGIDSININPDAKDPGETVTIDTQYSGWRATNGLRWQHIYSPSNFGVVTISRSEQAQHIDQQDQLINNTILPGQGLGADGSTPVYHEVTRDGTTVLGYDYTVEIAPNISLIAGSTAKVAQVNYDIAQPVGQQSPLSVDPARTDATSFASNFAYGTSGSYAEATWRVLPPWSITGGGRVQTFALGGHTTITPRLRTSYRLNEDTSLHLAYGEYAQMPPTVYILAYPQNRALQPIRARHYVAGVSLWSSRAIHVGIEAYRKQYQDYPVSTEYPQLSLANLVDTLGQQFIWIPMTSKGRGVSQGVELFTEMRLGRHFTAQANISYSRAKFSGLDGVLRAGNFDFPIVMNAAGTWHSGRRYDFSFRYEVTSGRPYTPFLYDESIAQNRGIYDVSQLNAKRGPAYSRLDFQINRNFQVGNGNIWVYAGLENAFNTSNFLGYAWMPRCAIKQTYCNTYEDGKHYTAVEQIPHFPNFGIRYLF